MEPRIPPRKFTDLDKIMGDFFDLDYPFNQWPPPIGELRRRFPSLAENKIKALLARIRRGDPPWAGG